jgi:O-succinylbenzoate synthase
MGREPLAEIKPEAVELYHVSMRLRSPFQTSFGVEHDRHCIILRVDSQGLSGWGECVAGEFPGYSYETSETAWHVLKDFFIPALVSVSKTTPEGLSDALEAFKGHPLARAGLEMALMDLQGKQHNRSLRDMLGGDRVRVPVGVSIGVQENLQAMLEAIESYLEQGYQRIKIKIKPGVDVDIVAGVRQYYPDLRLQVDANSAYRIEDAEWLCRLDDFNLQLIEQPLAEDDLLDHAHLQAQLSTPLCLDESILSERHARQALDIGACKVINIKAGRVGGLGEGKAIHRLCLERGVPVWCGGMLETNIGRAANLALAALPGFTMPGDISASDRYYAEDIAQPGFSLNPDSTINVPDQPGLGVQVDLDALERFTLRKLRMTF